MWFVMSLLLQDPVTERCVRVLAAATGEEAVVVLRRAVKECLERDRRTRFASPPVTQSMTEIQGYDDHGMPHWPDSHGRQRWS